MVNLGPIAVCLPDSRTWLRQFLVTAFDVAASATVLYVLLPQTAISWPVFLAVYAIAVGLGVLSHVPAGLGVFETVIIASLGSAVTIDRILSSTPSFRLSILRLGWKNSDLRVAKKLSIAALSRQLPLRDMLWAMLRLSSMRCASPDRPSVRNALHPSGLQNRGELALRDARKIGHDALPADGLVMSFTDQRFLRRHLPGRSFSVVAGAGSFCCDSSLSDARIGAVDAPAT